MSPVTAAAITTFTQVASESRVYSPDHRDPTPATLTSAVSDKLSAYTDANSDSLKLNFGDGEIGGDTFVPGVYTYDKDINISKDVTFDGKNQANPVFIIQTTGKIVQAVGKSVTLTNGATEQNIFWQVAGHVTVYAGASMKGVLLVKTAVTFNTESTLVGCILAQTAVTLQKASITQA